MNDYLSREDVAEMFQLPPFGCQMLNAGLDKSVVQRLLRHSDPKMTDRYAECQTSALKITLDNLFKLTDRNQVATKGKNNSITD